MAVPKLQNIRSHKDNLKLICNSIIMSKIEWTDQTWNPIIGCSKTSPGCDNCYAEKMAFRLASMEGSPSFEDMKYQNVISPYGKWMNATHFVKSALEKPLHWRKPQMIFVCSMGDLFHESVPFSWIMDVMDIIDECPQHTFQILTKRPERMLEYFGSVSNLDPDYVITPNLWLGVTAENQEQADKRIPILLQIPAAKRFVSIEPMLASVDLTNFISTQVTHYDNQLDWVILGGESGPKARPMHPDWVRSVRDQCQSAMVPFFFKSWGEWQVFDDLDKSKQMALKNGTAKHQIQNFNDHEGFVHTFHKVGKKQAGYLLDGKAYKEFPSPNHQITKSPNQ